MTASGIERVFGFVNIQCRYPDWLPVTESKHDQIVKLRAAFREDPRNSSQHDLMTVKITLIKVSHGWL